jgi:hypothetical protein
MVGTYAGEAHKITSGTLFIVPAGFAGQFASSSAYVHDWLSPASSVKVTGSDFSSYHFFFSAVNPAWQTPA